MPANKLSLSIVIFFIFFLAEIVLKYDFYTLYIVLWVEMLNPMNLNKRLCTYIAILTLIIAYIDTW